MFQEPLYILSSVCYCNGYSPDQTPSDIKLLHLSDVPFDAHIDVQSDCSSLMCNFPFLN